MYFPAAAHKHLLTANNYNFLTHAGEAEMQTKRNMSISTCVTFLCSIGHLNWTDPWLVWQEDSSVEIKVMKWHSWNVNWHSLLELQHQLRLMKHPWHTLRPGQNTLWDINLTSIPLMKVWRYDCAVVKWGHSSRPLPYCFSFLPSSRMSPEAFRYVHTEMSYADMKCLGVPLLVFHCHRLFSFKSTVAQRRLNSHNAC